MTELTKDDISIHEQPYRDANDQGKFYLIVELPWECESKEESDYEQLKSKILSWQEKSKKYDMYESQINNIEQLIRDHEIIVKDLMNRKLGSIIIQESKFNQLKEELQKWADSEIKAEYDSRGTLISRDVVHELEVRKGSALVVKKLLDGIK